MLIFRKLMSAVWQARRGEASCKDLLGQLQQLQQYLCSYAVCSVPVVDSKLSEVTGAVDQLHDYLLQCIHMAMLSDSCGSM